MPECWVPGKLSDISSAASAAVHAPALYRLRPRKITEELPQYVPILNSIFWDRKSSQSRRPMSCLLFAILKLLACLIFRLAHLLTSMDFKFFQTAEQTACFGENRWRRVPIHSRAA
jgi:hypothetical protein